MMKLVIPRDKWTGTIQSRMDDRTSNLCENSKGERCCLGHYLVAVNPMFPTMCINRSYSMPHDVVSYNDFVPQWLLKDAYELNDYDKEELVILSSDAASALAHLNDNARLPMILKEAGIAYIFEQYDVEVEFVD
jgi:hypothetical protein